MVFDSEKCGSKSHNLSLKQVRTKTSGTKKLFFKDAGCVVYVSKYCGEGMRSFLWEFPRSFVHILEPHFLLCSVLLPRTLTKFSDLLITNKDESPLPSPSVIAFVMEMTERSIKACHLSVCKVTKVTKKPFCTLHLFIPSCT